MEKQMGKIEVAARKTWQVVMAWIGGITALIAFFGSIGGGVMWLVNHHRLNVEYKTKMAMAQSELDQKQYREALDTYGAILKDDPLNRLALDGQLNAAIEWVEDFSFDEREGKGEDLSGAALNEILVVLTSGMTREKQTRLADVEAHLGWAHFLNTKIAQRENDSVAVSDWHDALALDSANVYAHAMLGNWMLQSGGNLNEAVEHFHSAVGTGRARPFVRRLQLGGLLYLEKPHARAELVRTANAMRIGGELMDPGFENRIANWCFDPVLTNHEELAEALGAVPNEEAWQTYLWLQPDPTSEARGDQNLNSQFIHANLLELSGRNDAALSAYRQIQTELRDRPGSLRNQVEGAIVRLTHGHPGASRASI